MKKKPEIGIAGMGIVGALLFKYFLESGWKRGSNLFCYDSQKKEYSDDFEKTSIIFVCVPTPISRDGSCDTSIVEKVIKKYRPPAGGPKKVFVVKSTIEPGTAQKLQSKYKVPVLFSPEFLTEANAWKDFINPDRQIVAYAENFQKHAKMVLTFLPKSKFANIHSIHSTEAELGKYASNVFGALKVVYSNIVADFAKALDADYENVRKVFSSDRRIGDSWTNVFYQSYRGYGGYCFPKDTDALIALGEKLGLKGVKVLKAMREYNEELLRSQGLNSKIVSSHDSELKQFLKNRVKKI